MMAVISSRSRCAPNRCVPAVPVSESVLDGCGRALKRRWIESFDFTAEGRAEDDPVRCVASADPGCQLDRLEFDRLETCRSQVALDS